MSNFKLDAFSIFQALIRFEYFFTYSFCWMKYMGVSREFVGLIKWVLMSKFVVKKIAPENY